MESATNQAFVREIIAGNRYLNLATTDGEEPWVATIEYVHDDELNFYFFSTDDARHSRHIEENPTVAISIYSSGQPDYSGDLSANLNGVQMRATARRLAEEEYPEMISGAIEAFDLPMPPYSAYKIEPTAFYIPRVENGINMRVRVENPEKAVE
ncbi:MAG: pyridoxamine 5'-phosphate oxidase family protein [Candidatus Promineifilaceae bacterium]|nr:pyridoxamine 5'-phosphate oxidase family protein [Candidatus Promineifilaceae bacterium]